MKHWLACLVSCLLWTCCASQGGCEEPPDINFGDVSDKIVSDVIVSDEKASYQEHDRIQYRCDPGYALEGSEWISCDGKKWTPPPKCLGSGHSPNQLLSIGKRATQLQAPCSITRQQLDAKNLLLPGGRRRSQLIRSNLTLEFVCREGYVIMAPSVRKCVDGRMDLPSCISERGKNCSRPPPIENGDIITLLQKEYLSGSWVEFKCQRYYAMEGPGRSFCNNGTWTKVPACLEPCVIALPESHQIEVKGSTYNTGFPTTYLPRGDSIEVSCKPGYVLETNPSQAAFLIQCNGEPIVYPKCKEITCNRPQLSHGTFRPQRNAYQGGDLIQLECNPGFQLENRKNIAECTSSGWSPSPQCGAAGGKCGRPPAIENGDITEAVVSQFPPNSVVNYKCQRYYTMHGQSAVRCTNGHWTEAPTCIAPCTATEEDMLSNKIQLKWRSAEKLYSESGSLVEFICRRGFQPDPSSPPFIVPCIEGRLEYPRCTRMFIANLPK